MNEKQKHLEAFELFYTLGAGATDNNARIIAGEFQVNERTVWNWYKKFNWKERAQLRNVEVGKGLEKKTNKSIIDIKANYQAIIQTVIQEQVVKALHNKEMPFKVENVNDFDKLTKLDLLLMGEATDKVEQSGEVKLDVHERIRKRKEYYDTLNGE